MYLKNQQSSISAENFVIPNQIQLDENNRWVVMANLIPWQEFEQKYADIFNEKLVAPAKPFRMALGALIIQQTKNITDRQTVEEIRENPYLQYFIGLDKFSKKIPFNSSMMVHFRKRIGSEIIDKINKKIVLKELKKKEESEESELEEKIDNKGKLILDASCTPADIAYPTDLGLLNKARLQTEKLIDELHSGEAIKVGKKPRTSREIARKNYLNVANHVDQIYRTRDNRRYCKAKGIKMSGPPLGRPKKNVSNEEKKEARENERIRNRVEGKFGEGKRRYGLNKIMTKLPSTSMTVISLIFLVMNLSYLYRQVVLIFLCQFSGIKYILRKIIKLSYQILSSNQEKVIFV